jgi:DNA-directed RNA polymerase specialized sigma24 family protein
MGDELCLIRAMARRDSSAWAVMNERHVGDVFGLVYHLLGGDHGAAEDVCQEVWLIAVERFDRFDPGRGSFRDWLLSSSGPVAFLSRLCRTRARQNIVHRDGADNAAVNHNIERFAWPKVPLGAVALGRGRRVDLDLAVNQIDDPVNGDVGPAMGFPFRAAIFCKSRV